MKVTKKVSSAIFRDLYDSNPWEVGLFQDSDRDHYVKRVKKSRFFYRNEPLISAIINRIADIGATDVVIGSGSLTKSETQLLNSISDMLVDYIRNAIRELLLSGLLFTEVYFDIYDDKELRLLGIQYKKEAILPKNITFRPPENLEIKGFIAQNDTSYYYIIPDKLIELIQTKGKSVFGEDSTELYKLLKENYPNIVKAVEKGENKVKVYPRYKVIYWNTMPDSVYPVPMLSPVLALLQHKRNIRRMDYSLAARAILMIMHIKAGNDEFPVTRDDEDILDDLREQMSLPSGTMYYDRIFQLFTNHTIDIDWITPPVDVLLDDNKYKYIDEEILMGLGFPRMLLTAEATRSQASSQDLADFIMRTMLNPIRKSLLIVVRQIIYDIIEKNGFRGKPSFIQLKPVHFAKFRDLFEALRYLYETRVISRTTFADFIGLVHREEIEKISNENEYMRDMGVEEFAPVPYSGKQPDGKNEEVNNDRNTV